MAKAAAQLGVSQPTVSEAIASLEHTFGVRLVDRSHQGIEPTMYGDALLKRSTAAFDELKQSSRDIEFLTDPTAGELKIGCSETLAATVLPPVIQRFSEKYPRAVLHMDDVTSPEMQYAGLQARKYDLILTRLLVPVAGDPFVEQDFHVEVLFNDQLVVAVGRHSRWARRRRIDLAELIDEPWILTAPRTWNYACVAEAFQAQKLDMPKVCLLTFSVHLRTHLLASGHFITVLPKSVMRVNSERYALKALPIDLPVRQWPVAIMTLKNRALSPVVERFIDCAREVAKPLAKHRT
jgi:DNA-binding transcriptional LysR family regulator